MKLIESWAAAAGDEVICRREGAAGIIVLNRPKALNAVTLGMVEGIAVALESWRHDPAVTRVVIAGAGGKAFCAGGDIRQIYEAGRAGQPEAPRRFWREEYLLNIAIKRYPKPYVALMDGIVMGGGVGLSLHGSHRVAAEKYLFAMPEVGIGFFPDVGATYALPRLPGSTGTWLAISGARVKAVDALALGLVTHMTTADRLDAILDGLVAGAPIDAVLMSHASVPEPAPVQAEREVIDRCFGAGSLAEILDRLEAEAAAGSVFAGETAGALRTKSPLSMSIALRQMRLGAALEFEAALALEWRIVWRMIDNPDFFEGVRAVVIDKDQSPKWRPARVDGVAEAEVDRFFAPLDGNELIAEAASSS
jgi:enoyl-CoA hydratase